MSEHKEELKSWVDVLGSVAIVIIILFAILGVPLAILLHFLECLHDL